MKGVVVESESVERLLVRHRTDLCAFLFASLRDIHATEDLYQEVALTVLRKSADFEEGTDFLAWARAIARNLLLKHWTTSNRSARPLSEETLDRLEQATAHEDPRNEKLRECLDRLEPDQRTLLKERYTLRNAVPAIAKRLGRSLQGTYGLLKRVRQMLRECMQRP